MVSLQSLLFFFVGSLSKSKLGVSSNVSSFEDHPAVPFLDIDTFMLDHGFCYDTNCWGVLEAKQPAVQENSSVLSGLSKKSYLEKRHQ